MKNLQEKIQEKFAELQRIIYQDDSLDQSCKEQAIIQCMVGEKSILGSLSLEDVDS